MEPLREVRGPKPFDETLWEDRFAVQEARREATESDSTLAGCVLDFLAQKRIEVNAGKLSAGRYDNIRRSLDLVLDYCGRSTAISSVSGKTMLSVRHHLLERIAADQISDAYAKEALAVFKSFVRWCGDTERLESPPSNLNSRNLTIQVSASAVRVLDIDQVHRLLEFANDRTRLYLLLMLNCGMTQKDIADLRHDEVDWKLGSITRRRSKTRRHEGVPVVTYRLWPETHRLLTASRSKDRERVLLTRDGLPLKTESLKDGDKLRKTDPIRLAINRLSTATGVEFQCKTLKKTSASLIRGAGLFHGLEDLFLGHAPRRISDKHYAQAPQALLDRALEWLGAQYGLMPVAVGN